VATTLLTCLFPLLCNVETGCMEEKPLSLPLSFETGSPTAGLTIAENLMIDATLVETLDGDIHLFSASGLTGTWLISTTPAGGRAILSAHTGVADALQVVWADGQCVEETP
jgi:hypothetical protein